MCPIKQTTKTEAPKDPLRIALPPVEAEAAHRGGAPHGGAAEAAATRGGFGAQDWEVHRHLATKNPKNPKTERDVKSKKGHCWFILS